MKTSPELLTDILGVLGTISTKLDSIANKPADKKVGAGAVLGAIIKGKKAADDVSSMAKSIKQLNTEINKINTKKLESLVKTMESYYKMERENAHVKTKKRTGLAAAAKDMGLALMYTAAGVIGFIGAFALAGKVLKISPWGVLGFIALTSLVMAFSMAVIAGGDAAGEAIGNGILGGAKGNLKGEKGRGKSAIESAKEMGIALMYIAGGILSTGVALALLPIVLGVPASERSPAKSFKIFAGIIIGVTALVALVGLAGSFVAPGIKAAKGIGIALGVITLGILAVAFGAKILMGMGDKDAKKKDGSEKGKFGQMMAGIGAGLGLFGLFVISSVGMLWVLGLPVVMGPVMLGAITLMMTSFALMSVVKSSKNVAEAVNEMGGTKGVQDLSSNIRLLVGGVMGAIIDGVMGNLDKPGKHGESPDGNLSLRELRQFNRVRKAIKTFSKIATSLSKFAKGLRAFAKLGEIASLDYEEVDGEMKPKIDGGDKIHVIEIAHAIAGTFGLFIENMIKNTENLTKKQADALKKFSRALTGDKGLISGVSQFADALKTYAEFGKAKQIYVTAYNEDGTIDETRKEAVPIDFVVSSIVESFGTFVDNMVSKAPAIEDMNMRKMKRFNEALMGKKGMFGREKPGLLDAVTEFSSTLALYATMGADASIPQLDAEGKPVMKDGKPVTTPIATVAANMMKGITAFVGAFEKEAGTGGLDERAKTVKGKIQNIVSIIDEFEKLAKAQSGMEKLANSMGLLANNIGTLTVNLGALDVTKLQTAAVIAGEHAKTTKGVAIPKTTATPVSGGGTGGAQPDWDKIAEKIGNVIAAKLAGSKSAEYQFRFMDPDSLKGTLFIKQ